MSLPVVDADIIATAWMVGKVSVLLAAAVMTNALLYRRASAATRHLVWTITIVGLLLLPMLSAVLPGWTAARLTAAAPLLTSRDAGLSAPAVVPPARSPRTAGWAIGIPWSTALPALYAAGVLLLLARLIAEQVAMQRLAGRATAISEPEITHLLVECARRMGVRRPVRVLRSREHSMPMVFGTRVPAIVLPAVADAWSPDRRRAVLLHELAHVARYDCLTQMAAAVACAVYWIHPGVWWVARRLRVERELACDDRVLTAGTHPREYAGHLLELARTRWAAIEPRRSPCTWRVPDSLKDGCWRSWTPRAIEPHRRSAAVLPASRSWPRSSFPSPEQRPRWFGRVRTARRPSS